jgi:hypothetical protein
MRPVLQIWILLLASFLLGSSLGTYWERHRSGSRFVALKRKMMNAYQEGQDSGQSLLFVLSFLENSDSLK